MLIALSICCFIKLNHDYIAIMQSIHAIDLSNVAGLEKQIFRKIRPDFYYLVLADASKQPKYVKSFEINTKTLQTEKTVELGFYTDIQTNNLVLAPVQDVSKRQPLMKCILSFRVNLQPNTVYKWCLSVCLGEKLDCINYPSILAVFNDTVSISLAAIKGNVCINYSCNNLGYFNFTAGSSNDWSFGTRVFVRFSARCKNKIVNLHVSFVGTFHIFHEMKLDLNSVMNHITDADTLNDERYQDIVKKMIKLETKCDKQGEKLVKLEILLSEVLERQSTVLFPLLRKLLVNQLQPKTVEPNEPNEPNEPIELSDYEEDYETEGKGYWLNPLYECIPEMKQNQEGEAEGAFSEASDILAEKDCLTPNSMPSLVSDSSRQSSKREVRITSPPQHPPPQRPPPPFLIKIDSNFSAIPLESQQRTSVRPVSPPNEFGDDWELADSFDGK